MLAIRAMLAVLDDRVKATSQPLQENVVPIVSAFCQMARGDRVIRKYLRQEVLPPLGRVGTTRPEEGHLIRNELVRLMTSPLEDIKVGGTQLLWRVLNLRTVANTSLSLMMMTMMTAMSRNAG